MKKIYETPKSDIITFHVNDIITASQFDDIADDPFGDVGPSWFSFSEIFGSGFWF